MDLSSLFAAILSLFKKPQTKPAASLPEPKDAIEALKANAATEYPVVNEAAPITEAQWLTLCRPLTKISESCQLIAYCDPASPRGVALQRDGLWYKYLANRMVAADPKYQALKADPWTLGWGQTGTDINSGSACTQAEADEWLDTTLKAKAAAVDRLVTVSLQPNQKAALVDWTYNEGEGNLATSTMLKRLNEGNFDQAMTELLRWNIAGGKINSGLLTRRAREKELFRTGAWQ